MAASYIEQNKDLWGWVEAINKTFMGINKWKDGVVALSSSPSLTRTLIVDLPSKHSFHGFPAKNKIKIYKKNIHFMGKPIKLEIKIKISLNNMIFLLLLTQWNLLE